MAIVEETLKPLDGYLFAIKRDTVNGWYYLEVGLPKSWIYRGNDIIDCVKLNEWNAGNLIKVTPKVEGITLDDLIKFTQLILDTNAKILEKVHEFEEKIKQVKESLNADKIGFNKELDDLREQSFGAFDYNSNITPVKKRGRGRPKGSTTKKNPKPKDINIEDSVKEVELDGEKQ